MPVSAKSANAAGPGRSDPLMVGPGDGGPGPSAEERLEHGEGDLLGRNIPLFPFVRGIEEYIRLTRARAVSLDEIAPITPGDGASDRSRIVACVPWIPTEGTDTTEAGRKVCRLRTPAERGPCVAVAIAP